MGALISPLVMAFLLAFCILWRFSNVIIGLIAIIMSIILGFQPKLTPSKSEPIRLQEFSSLAGSSSLALSFL
jgi:hypothetical protein